LDALVFAARGRMIQRPILGKRKTEHPSVAPAP